MSDVKVIVCLANSRKHNERCVAGIEIVDRRSAGWVRPVSSRAGAEVSEYERHYADESEPQVLDLIRVPLLGATPDGYQVENWLLDPDLYWERVGTVSWDELALLVDNPEPLWECDAPSTYYGMFDRVAADDADRFGSSLRLIPTVDLVLRVFAPGTTFGNSKRRVQGGFTYLGIQYRVWVTDPVIEQEYLAMEDGDYEIGESYLTMSLGERSDDGYCYKLIAAVISRERAEGAV